MALISFLMEDAEEYLGIVEYELQEKMRCLQI